MYKVLSKFNIKNTLLIIASAILLGLASFQLAGIVSGTNVSGLTETEKSAFMQNGGSMVLAYTPKSGVTISEVQISARSITCNASGASNGDWKATTASSPVPTGYDAGQEYDVRGSSDLNTFRRGTTNRAFAHNDRLCFRIKYSKTVNSQVMTGYQYALSPQYDGQGPRLAIMQEANKITITSNDPEGVRVSQGAAAWQFGLDTEVVTAGCSLSETRTAEQLKDIPGQFYTQSEVDTAFAANTAVVYSFEASRVVIYLNPDQVTSTRLCVQAQDKYSNANTEHTVSTSMLHHNKTTGSYSYVFDLSIPDAANVLVTQTGMTIKAELQAGFEENLNWSYQVIAADTSDAASPAYTCNAAGAGSDANVSKFTAITNGDWRTGDVMVSSTDGGKFYCFRYMDRFMNTGYKLSSAIDLTAPVVEINQSNLDNNNEGTVTFTFADTEIVGSAASDWSNAMVKTTRGPVTSSSCDSRTSLTALPDDPAEVATDTSYAKAAHASNSYTITFDFDRNDNGRYVCVSLQDGMGNYAYERHRIDLSLPRIGLRYQDNSMIVMERLNRPGITLIVQMVNLGSTDDAGTTTRNAAVNSSARCEQEDKRSDTIFTSALAWGAITASADGTYRVGESTALTAADDNDRYCFRVTASSDFTTQSTITYAYHMFDYHASTTPAPRITTTSVGNSVRATISSSVPDAQKIKPGEFKYIYLGDEDPGGNCDARFDTSNPGQKGDSDYLIVVTVPNNNNNEHYYCFQAMNWAGVSAYVSHKVTSDTTAPTIVVTVSDDGSTVTASSSDSDVDANTWRYVVRSVNPDCTDNSLYTSAMVGRIARLTEEDRKTNKYVCFRVSDTSSNFAYKEQFVEAAPTETTPPTTTPPTTTPPTTTPPTTTPPTTPPTTDPDDGTDGEDQNPDDQQPGEPEETTVTIRYDVDQSSNTLTFRATTTGDGQVDADTWKYVRVDTEAECTASAFGSSAESPTGDTIEVTEADYGKFICLMVSSSDGQSDIKAVSISDDGSITEDTTGQTGQTGTTDGTGEGDGSTDDEGSSVLPIVIIVVIVIAVVGLIVVMASKKKDN